MKIGDLVKFSEECYPEYKGLIGMLTEKKLVNGTGRGPMWQVMVRGRVHPFYVRSEDIIAIVGSGKDKMTGEGLQ